MKYVIMADTNNIEPFKTPRQLEKIGKETIIGRTIRLLKENGIKNIIITSHDKRFDKFDVERYEPLNNSYNGKKQEGHWLDAFTRELLTEPICFLFGDVFYSENAIKLIVECETDDVLFFCTDIKNQKDQRYIKHHDEPLAFKVVNTEKFKEHIDQLNLLFDEGKLKRRPIAWELYRSLNDIPVAEHKLTKNYIAINDITCDIDNVEDVKLIEDMAKKKFMKLEITKTFDDNETKIRRYVGEIVIVDEERGKYLLGDNKKGENGEPIIVAELIEIYGSEIREE